MVNPTRFPSIGVVNLAVSHAAHYFSSHGISAPIAVPQSQRMRQHSGCYIAITAYIYISIESWPMLELCVSFA